MTDPEQTPAPAPEPPSKEELQQALAAFRKRLRVTQLDDESRIGRGPMSSGGKSRIVAITPPNQFRRAVWQELANQGKLKYAGNGLYELVGS